MKIEDLKRCKRIYICCPEGSVSGGPEALHQLRYYMEQVLPGKEIYATYFLSRWDFCVAEVPNRYTRYFPNGIKVVDGNKIEDCKDNLVIAPESCTGILHKFRRARKAVWWLSTTAHDSEYYGKFKNVVRFVLRKSLKNPLEIFKINRYYVSIKRVFNFCASQVAYDFVTTKYKVKAYKLIEPISKEFLEIGMVDDCKKYKRENVVAYNPAKPSKIMDWLLEQNKYEFVPIKGMTFAQIAETMRKVKLYVDFGSFPGPERIPKEAVYNGANIIVGKRGGSVNDFDVNIPNKYKIEKADDNPEEVCRAIDNGLKNYEKNFPDYDVFRKQIDCLEENFKKDIQKYFGK